MSESTIKRLIAVPTGWSIYEVEGDFQITDAKGRDAIPPHVAMETLVLAGKAKRLASIQSMGDGAAIEMEIEDGEGGDDHPGAESEGLWFSAGE